jgi:molybdopterin/thiamine biosynthesis adenylyltransferase
VSLEQLVQQYDVILSPSDPLHDVCYAAHRPFLCAQISSDEAWLFGCRGYEPDSPCLHCLPALVVDNGEESITEAEAFFIGTLQTTEALKIVLGVDAASRGKLLRCQFPTLQFTEQVVKKDPSCSLCGQGGR